MEPLVFDAGPFMERSGRPVIELLLEIVGKGRVKSAGNDVRAGSCPHRRQNAGRAERNRAWVFANLPRRSARSPRAGCWSHRTMK